MYPHRIRLRGPWEADPGGRVVLPAPLATTGSLRLIRRFGYPGRIDPVERVYLTIDHPACPCSLTVNDVALGQTAISAAFEITSLLRERNTLIVELDLQPAVSPWDEVALEVRRTAFLENVRVFRAEGLLQATGEIVGSCAEPLDLYLLAGGSTVAYAGLTISAERTPFHLRADQENTAGEGTVEMTQGAVRWYVVPWQLTHTQG